MKTTIVHYLSLLPLFLLFTCNGNAQEPSINEVVTLDVAAPAIEDDTTPNFLFLADIHLNHEAEATPRKDDTGTKLWSATKKRLQQTMNSPNAPKFIIYTGDLTAHSHQHEFGHLSQSQLDTNMAIVLNDLHAIVGDVPLFYAPGNNDALEGDYANFATSKGKTPFSLVDSARMHYPAPNATMVSSPNPGRGYYSARPFNGLRVIALNSVIFGREHWTFRSQQTFIGYGNTMMQWLTQELVEVDSLGEKAYIIMHIPPGIDAYSGKHMWDRHESDRWQKEFLQLASDHQDDIAGVFYGHTHMDELRLLAQPGTKDTVITEVAISGPGISPNHGQNPAFKTVSYNATSFDPVDFTTYYTSQYAPKWSPSDKYTFSEKYGGLNIGDLTGKLLKDKYKVINNGLHETYKAGKGRDTSDLSSALIVW